MAVSRTVFGVGATGLSRNGWVFAMRSKQLFSSRTDAEGYFREFADKCCDEDTYFECARREGLRMFVIEYELEGADAEGK